MKRTLSLVLSLLLVVQMVLTVLPAMAAPQVLATFEDTFDSYDVFGSIYDETATGAVTTPTVTSLPTGWTTESGKNTPKVENNVLKLVKGDGAVFNWADVGFAFDVNDTYTLTFDVKATDMGTITGVAQDRELYFAPGGHYNLFEFCNHGIRAGNNSSGDEAWAALSKYTKGTTYSCKVVWEPAAKKMTCTVMNGATQVISGSRTLDDFGAANNYTKKLVFRCEDGASEISNVTFTSSTKAYSQFETGLTPLPAGWVKEGLATYAPNEPKVQNGILKFVAKDGVRLNWTELPGFSFDASKDYTLTFDVKITNFGVNSTSDYRREVYFAPDGWFNMLELKHDTLRAGDTYNYNTATDYKLNTLYSCTVVWDPSNNKMTCTLKNGETTVVTGSRTKTEFGTLNDRTKNFVWRCEEGAMEVSNVKFTDGANTYTQFKGTSSGGGVIIPVSPFVWEKEYSADKTDDFGGYTGNQPMVEGGVAKLNKKDSLRFNWPSAGFTFDATKTYTMKFDVKVNSFGETMDTNMNREFYFAPGGWYNMMEFRGTQQSGKNLALGIRAGGDSGSGIWSAQNDYQPNTTYTCEVVWEPSAQKMTATVMNGSTVVVTGSRTKPDFASLNNYTRSFALRCENGSIEIDNFSFTDGTDTYTQNFYDKAMTGEGYWSAENKIYSTVALKPVVTSGADALVLEDNTGVFFNWKNVPGATPFTTTKTFTFEFDAELTGGEGDKDACSARSRSLYVGFGGWYNLFEVHTADDGESAGAVISGSDAKAPWGDNYKNIHVKIEWQGTTATTTITDKNGNLLLTGKRTHSSFTNMEDKYMNAMGIRCEDGKAVIDNFKFKVTDTAVVASKEVNIPSGEQAYYECDIACSNANSTRITLSGNQVFGYNNGALTLGAKGIKGTFNPGIYNFKMWINPVQNMVTTEAISPDGEIVSRAIYTLSDAFTNGDDIMVFSDAADPILKENLEYLTVNKSAYQIVNEPAYTGYEEKVHNVVTSFIENAATDRAFAWTAMANYIGTSDMAVKYRPQGASTWQEVTATKVQNDHVANEEYFKADIYDLTPETTYEYKIGKKGAGDSDWSKTYTFKTAATEIDEFTFVAVGDTQGEGWTGRGFQFARAALDEAFKENSDAAFMLHTGDIVEIGTNIGMWNTYFKALGEYGTKYPHFATMGNHITYGNDYTGIDNWNNHFNHPNNDTAPIDISKTTGLTDSALKHLVNNYANGETIYSFDYGNAHFIVLNTGAFSKAQDDILMKAQREWLEKDLEAHKDATWTIVLQHQTVYHRIGDTSNYDRQALADLLEEEYGVDLVIQGHSHLVTRTYPMMNRQIVTKQYDKVIPKGIGTVYMTIGSTTTNHDGVPDTINDEEIFKMAVPMSEGDNRPTRSMPAYTTVKITDEELKLVIKQADGLILDEFTIKGECNHVPGDWETVVEPTTLAPGKQELRCGKCGALMETKELPKLVEIPKTGDDTNLYLLTVCLLVSLSGICALMVHSKKRKA